MYLRLVPFRQRLADRVVRAYLRGYDSRMRVARPRWVPKVASRDPAIRRKGLVLLHDFHEACHDGAFRSMRLKPSDWETELSEISLTITLRQAEVSASDVEFAVLDRDTLKIEEHAKLLMDRIAAGFSDDPADRIWNRGQTVEERAIAWHHAELINVASVHQRIYALSPRAERLQDHEGMPDVLARLGTAAGQMQGAGEHLTRWLDGHPMAAN